MFTRRTKSQAAAEQAYQRLKALEAEGWQLSDLLDELTRAFWVKAVRYRHRIPDLFSLFDYSGLSSIGDAFALTEDLCVHEYQLHRYMHVPMRRIGWDRGVIDPGYIGHDEGVECAHSMLAMSFEFGLADD